MKIATNRCSLGAFTIGLLLLLGLIVACLDFKIAWSSVGPSSKPKFHSVRHLAHNKTGVAYNERGIDGPKLQFVKTLHHIAQNTSHPRGIVMPVYEHIVKVAASLILELRSMGVTEPIEMPYCGDVSPQSQSLLLQKAAMGSIRFYDVCALAASATVEGNASQKVFCPNITSCHTKFRNFDLKVVSVVFSKFEEIMMVDADTAFFVNPAVLWDSAKYQSTGTLLMNDRHAHDIHFMAQRVRGRANVSYQHMYMSTFDPVPFRFIPTLERAKATVPNPASVTLLFEPSNYLLTSHSWNLRTGHQVDSSLMFWNKKKQPRATAILASFKALCDVGPPPSYGDKELYFYAAELAETQYSFSDHTISGVGTYREDHGEGKSTLCGDMAQPFPIKQDRIEDVPLFYLNSDRVLRYKPAVEVVYYVKARMADVYLGSYGKRRIDCPFNITVAEFSEVETRHLSGRQRLHEFVVAWWEIAQSSGKNVTLNSMATSIDGMVDEQMEAMRKDYRHVKVPNVSWTEEDT